MSNKRIYLLENFDNTPWIILEDASCVLLRDYNLGPENFLSPNIQDFKDYIELLGNIDFPYLMFNNTFECPQLSKIKYDLSTVELLNAKGLHIFLTENLLKYNNLRVEHSHINIANMLQFNNDSGLCSGIFENPRTGQLDSIQDLIDNNQLTNVTVHVAEHGVANALPRYSNMKFVWKDLYLQQFIKRYGDTTAIEKKDIRYTFINTNWRYEPFRHIIAAYLKNYNSKISWCYKSTSTIFKNNMWFEPSNDLLQGFEKLNNAVPCNIDIDIKTPTILQGGVMDRFKLPNYNNYHPTLPNADYNDVFCSVVTESSFLDSTTYISDKTITAILNCMPFIIVGPPHVLKTAQNMGFKTFNNYWDESYDNEFDHSLRMKKILELIDTISKFTKEELTTMQQDMQSICIYNKQHIKAIKL
jgi:hypothetical protein